MKSLAFAALALTAGASFAQNSASGLSVVPGMSGESSGTVTGTGPGRTGAFGSPPDTPDVGAARGSTQGRASAESAAGAGRGTGTGTRKRPAPPPGVPEPR